jgi:hypothetical protein
MAHEREKMQSTPWTGVHPLKSGENCRFHHSSQRGLTAAWKLLGFGQMFTTSQITKESFNFMKLHLVMLCAAAVLIATPALAKKQKKAQGGIGSGLNCNQGGQNVYIPNSQLPAKYRGKFRKGQKATVNIAGFGPVYCVVY